jgi:copper(I)-binding protein
MDRTATVATLSFAALLLGAAPSVGQTVTTQTGLTISTPWARATPGGAKVGAAYLSLKLPASIDDTLVAASSPVAGSVELHTHMHDGGVMRMRRLDKIAVGGGNTVTFRPGGLHIMLIDLKQPLKEGDRVPLTLRFEKAGEVALDVPVLKVGSPGPGGADGEHRGGHHGGHGKH